MTAIQEHRQAATSAARGLRVQLTISSLVFCLGAPLLLHAAQVRGADEDFPVGHNKSITIRILSGVDGHPVAHACLSLLAGYNQRDLHQEMWHQESSTDDQGLVRLPDALANLPFLEINVARTSACQEHAGSATFSVDLIRRDGLSTPNRCGPALSDDAPGVFTVFVKTRPTPQKRAPSGPHPLATLAAQKR